MLVVLFLPSVVFVVTFTFWLLEVVPLLTCWLAFVLPVVPVSSIKTSFTSTVILEFLSSYKTTSFEFFPIWVTVFLLLELPTFTAVKFSATTSIPFLLILLTPYSSLT